MTSVARACLASVALLASACAHAPSAPLTGTNPLPSPAGTPAWEAAAKRMLSQHDRDRSGTLDAAELAAIDCSIWNDLDHSLRADLGSGLAELYGLAPGYLFRAEPLGIAFSERQAALTSTRRCGEAAPRDDDPTARVLSKLARIAATPTSAEWDDEVAMVLLMTYDTNHSGLIDRPPEVSAIPCEVWVALERSVRAERGTSLLALYGFAPGYIWIGQMLAISEDLRDRTADLMTECGLDD